MRGLAIAHGAYWLVGGLWPLVHYRSFEFVFGSKREDWLVQSVASLMAPLALALLLAKRPSQEIGLAAGLGAAGLGWIGLRESRAGRVSPLYALDGVVELALAAAWAALLLRDSQAVIDEQERGRLL